MKRPSVEDIKRKPEWHVYATTCARVLAELRGWTEERTEVWLEERLQNPGFRSWFPHDPPSKELAWLLMPDDLRDRLVGPHVVDLRNLITDAIDLPGDEHNSNPDTDPNYDWEAARHRVAKAIEEFRRSEQN